MADYDLIKIVSDESGGGLVRVSKEAIEGSKRLSARDIIAVACKKDQNNSAAVWRNLKPEIQVMLEKYKLNHKFKGKGQQMQPVLNLYGVFKLLMVLSGEHAQLFRCSIAQTLLKHFDGDQRLISEIRANSEFSKLINQVTDEDLQNQDVIDNTFELDHKRRLENVEIMKAEDAAKRRRLKLDLETKLKTVDVDIAVNNKHLEAELQAMARKSQHERDLLDQESLAKRRRIEKEAQTEDHAKEVSILHAQFADLGGSLERLATTLRGVNFPEDVVAVEVAKHYAYLKSRLPEVPIQPMQAEPVFQAQAAVPAVGGEFTVKSFVAQHQLLRGVPTYRHDPVLRKIGTKLVDKCRSQGIVLGPQVHEGAFVVNSYSPAAAGIARSIAEEVVRQELAGPAQQDIRVSFATSGLSAVPT